MRKRGLHANSRRLPLPPDVREAAKKALRKIHADHTRRRGEIRKQCREQVAAAKLARNKSLAKLDEEYAQRVTATRAEFEAKASERLLKSKVRGDAARGEF